MSGETLGAHVVETARARLYRDVLRTFAGLSWASDKRDEMARRLAPFDAPAQALYMAGRQSNCAIAVGSALREAGFDGTVRNYYGKASWDPLRAPRWGRYDSVSYLETLALQRKAKRPVVHHKGERPDIFAGSWILIGGSEAAGGEAHVVGVDDVREDGVLLTIEGGKLDPANPRTGAAKCTAIAADTREIYWNKAAHGWYLRDEGDKRAGRRVIYWCWTGDLPLK